MMLKLKLTFLDRVIRPLIWYSSLSVDSIMALQRAVLVLGKSMKLSSVERIIEWFEANQLCHINM